MRQLHHAALALLAGLAALGWGANARADDPPEGRSPAQAAPAPEGKDQGKRSDQQKPKAFGAGLGGQGAAGYCLVPLDTGGMCAGPGQGQGGFGAGIGGERGEQSGGATEPGKVAEGAAPAPVPQFWLADASLFTANAGNAAETLANEETLGVQAPSVLGNQAQFLLASTDRALSSLASLKAHAEATTPKAVPEIRAAMDELVAAKAQAQQALDAANAGTLGPNAHAAIRSTYDHLQAAERQMGAVGRTYGAPGFTLALTCGARGGRGFGVGIGGKGAPAPQKGDGAKAPAKETPPAPPKETPPPAGGEPTP